MEKTQFINFYGVREAKSGKGVNLIFVAGDGDGKRYYSAFVPLAGKKEGAKASFMLAGDGRGYINLAEVWKPRTEKKEPAEDDPEGAVPVEFEFEAFEKSL